MSSVQLRYDDVLQRADLVRAGNLVTDAGLESAVIISLFSNARARPEDDVQGDQGGWWADAFAPDRIGGRLWTQVRGTTTDETLRLTEDAAKEALQWLVDDGVAASVTATAETVGTQRRLTVVIEKPANAGRFEKTWEIPFNAV